MKRDGDKWKPPRWLSSRRQGESLVEDLHLLLGDLCRAWGFCSALADDILANRGSLTADEFATAVLAAEGWPDPEQAWEWRLTLAKVFTARYGACASVADYRPRGDR